MSKYCHGCKKLVSNSKWNYAIALCDKCKYRWNKEQREIQEKLMTSKKEAKDLKKQEELLKSDNVVLEYQRMRKFRDV